MTKLVTARIFEDMEYAIELDETLLNISRKLLDNGISEAKRARGSDGAFGGFFSKHIIETFKQISSRNLIHVYPKVGGTLCKLVNQIVTHRDFFERANRSDIARLCFLAKALLDTAFSTDKAFNTDTGNHINGFIEIWSKTMVTVLNCIGIFIKDAKALFINDIYKCLRGE